MLYEKIQFDKDNEDAFLEVYVADKVGSFTRNAILVMPGGGYSNICSEREGEPIAMAFMPYGYNSFVLHYSVGKEPFPLQLIQASKAIKHIKDNSEKYNIDPEKVFVVGFSAGGHLAASIGTMWDKKEIYEKIDMPYGYNKPAGMMLIYPVISAEYHKRSFQNLLMEENFSLEEIKECSIENHIGENACPAYIMHISNDEKVDVKNSLVLAEKLSLNNIKFEMHIYPDAPHGVALGNKITMCGIKKFDNVSIAEWVKNAVRWAETVE